jgi:rRNA small subunit pseudouridine methyltransferase Nep1
MSVLYPEPKRDIVCYVMIYRLPSQMISLVIAEAAIETVPIQIIDHPSVRNHAKRTGRRSNETLLDRSYHHSAMIHADLKSEWKRGRPDIVHFALMEALSTPLFLRRRLKVHLHTINNNLISIGENVRIPKSYFRFEALMIDLFKKKVIMPDNDAGYSDEANNNSNEDNAHKNILLQLHEDMTLSEVIQKMIRPSTVIGLSTVGVQKSAQSIVEQNVSAEDTNCAFVIGGFARGHFSNDTTAYLKRLYSIGHYRLEAHVVIARIIYECEKILHM